MWRRSGMGVAPVLGALIVSFVFAGFLCTVGVTSWAEPMTKNLTAFPVLRPTGVWVWRDGQEGFTLFLGVKNEGSSAATISDLLLDEVPFREVGGETRVAVGSGDGGRLLDPDDPGTHLTLRPGEKGQIRLALPGDVFSMGDVVGLDLVTLDGVEHVTSVILL